MTAARQLPAKLPNSKITPTFRYRRISSANTRFPLDLTTSQQRRQTVKLDQIPCSQPHGTQIPRPQNSWRSSVLAKSRLAAANHACLWRIAKLA